jgi:hypothetical protein
VKTSRKNLGPGRKNEINPPTAKAAEPMNFLLRNLIYSGIAERQAAQMAGLLLAGRKRLHVWRFCQGKDFFRQGE